MKKMIKKLVAVMVMGAMVTTPVFAKDGDKYYNEQLGVWLKEVHINGEVWLENQTTGGLVKKGDMRQIATYTLGKEAGIRTMNTIIKNGIAMVSINELADVMDLELKDWDTCYNLTGYNEYGGVPMGMNIYKPESNAVKNGTHYSSGTTIEHEDNYIVNPSIDINFAPKNAKFKINRHDAYSDFERTIPAYSDIDIEGAFSVGKAEYINGVLYVPAKEVINLINQDVTDVTYDKNSKTISFEKKNQYYNKTLSYVPY